MSQQLVIDIEVVLVNKIDMSEESIEIILNNKEKFTEKIIIINKAAQLEFNEERCCQY